MSSKIHVSVPKDCAKKIPLAKRPHGYVYVACHNLVDRSPEYYGQIELRDKLRSVLLYFMIDHLCMVKKYYRVNLFKDNDLKCLLKEIHVQFTDETCGSIKVYSNEDRRNPCYSLLPELNSFIHCIIHEFIIKVFIPEAHHALCEWHGVTGWEDVFPFTDDTLEDFLYDTCYSFEKLVIVHDTLLN